MKYDRDIYNRHSIRLKEYDYSQPGWYFITICAKGKECLFGDINNGKINLNEYGIIAKKEWLETASIRKNIELDEFIIMPNHYAGMIIKTRFKPAILIMCVPFLNPSNSTGLKVAEKELFKEMRCSNEILRA